MKTENELIAEFIGGKRLSENEYTFWRTPIGQFGCTIEGMKFHTSWDWLMAPCQKFCSMKPSSVWDQKVYFNAITGEIERAIWDYLYSRGEIKSVFDSLVKGIKWYNQQTLK